MPDRNPSSTLRNGLFACVSALLAILGTTTATAGPVDVSVVDPDGNAVEGPVRWILEEDLTYDIDPNNPPTNPTDLAAFQLHKSYMPIAESGETTSGSSFQLTVDDTKRYYLSVLPHADDSLCGAGEGSAGSGCYSISGAPLRGTDTAVEVVVQPQPIPVAQARVLVFDDRAPVNNAWDAGEPGLGDFTVFIYDAGGGPLVTNAFGDPLDTVYNPGTGEIISLGDGTLLTMNGDDVTDPAKNPLGLKAGELLIQNLVPGKYGIRVVAPAGEEWQQTTTIEGTPGIDVWLRAGEPMFAVEFGPATAHAWYGMVKETDNLDALPADAGRHSISGTVYNLRIARPADTVFTGGQQELGGCWIGLNNAPATEALYIAPCNKFGEGEASFTISGVPDGTYGLVVWDDYLLNIISFLSVTVAGGDVDLNVDGPQVNVPRWFGTQEHFVYEDKNGNGFRDVFDGAIEPGIPEQAINLRYRDGSIFQASATDLDGYLPLEEVFPWFSWLVAEVDFARYKATGVRVTVDEGGPVFGDPDDLLDPGNGVRNPQVQAGGALQRVESYTGTCTDDGGTPIPDCEVVEGPPLTEGYNIFAGTNFKFEWGKSRYQAGENGGISGVVFNQTTRAENDPRYAAAEPWEPGVPRVQVNLYETVYDATLGSEVIKDQGSDGIQLADIDNYPFCWSDADTATDTSLCPSGGVMGPEDVNRTGGTDFDLGDAITYSHTDSWDDSIPTGCIGDTLAAANGGPYSELNGRCYDSLRNFSQVRPAVFDGGFGLGAPWDGTTDYLASGIYIVEAAAPPGYEHQDELSKNVDFGDTFMPQALPPACVGHPDFTGGAQPANDVESGAFLELFGGVQVDERYTGDRPYCSMKLVDLKDQKNAAAEFFLYTEVPVSAHIQGNVLNDLANSLDPNSPTFGEKAAAPNIPISMRDFAGNEVNRLYTDRYGRYNGLVPSTYTINAPMPTGVSPNMLQVCLNPRFMKNPALATDPTAEPEIEDPNFDSRYSPVCYDFQFNPGLTTYLDTPVLPAGAFVNTTDWQLDCAYPTGTPVIAEVVGGPVVQTGVSTSMEILSAGLQLVRDPTMAFPATVERDFGFGGAEGTVLIDGVEADVTTWGTDSIVIDTGSLAAGAHQLEIVRVDGQKTEHGLSIVAIDNPADALTVPSQYATIQAAIDAADAGDVVLVEPGVYNESLFMTKPVQLQGYGAGVTTILAGSSRSFGDTAWRDEANRRVNCAATDAADRIGLLPGQPNNVANGTVACGHVAGTGLFATEENAAVFVAPLPGAFGASPARIDGFTLTGATYAAGVIVNGYAHNLEISNNVIENNSGVAASGIRVGQPSLLGANGDNVYADNVNLNIHHNNVRQNSVTFENGGGIGLFTGSDNYRVESNFICGNYTQGDGAGIAHFGRSTGGLIKGNKILFNESFDQTAGAQGGGGGGIFVGGHQQGAAAEVRVTAGSGPVKIVENIIHGNHAGSDDGGGILVRSANGQDLLAATPDNRDSIEILGNMITNNVAGLAGGGIALQDATNVSIINNTITNNDSTATSAAAFINPNQTANQPAGIVSRAHGPDLLGLGIAGIGDFSDPVMDNNIIMGNRSMSWSSITAGGLTVDQIWDLGILGVDGLFSPRDNILSSVGGNPGTSAPYVADNIILNVGREDNMMVSPYSNGSNGAIPNPNQNTNYGYMSGRPLLATAAQDEGGNFIIVSYGPLTLQPQVPGGTPTGDYHLEANSQAIDRGDVSHMLGKTRPVR